MEVLIFWAVMWILCAVVGGWIASQKGRDPGEGVVLGLLLGFIGVFIELLMPTKGP